MINQPTEHETKFRIFFSFNLEVMTETFNSRLEKTLNAIMIFLGASVFANSHLSWLCGAIVAVLSGIRIAWDFGRKAESAKQQARRYANLIDKLPDLDMDEMMGRLAMIEEMDSKSLTSLYNPARNRACISMGMKHREKLSCIERVIAMVSGGIPD